ncbi:methyl-accepting chemotaxis protein [Telmatobacter bradus]|uniref:methyl-accepting chemotaxis protein n=1 Tax=Telmatobacter bradus TaxID=474953 RepID=UPI003B43938E
MFNNLGLSQKFLGAFGAICLLCMIQGGTTLIGLRHANGLTKDLTVHSLPAAQAASEMGSQMQAARRMELASLLCSDSACLDAYDKRRATALDKYDAAKAKFMALDITPENKAEFQSAEDAFATYRNQSDEIMRTNATNTKKDIMDLGRQEQQLLGNFNTAFNTIVKISDEYGTESNQNSTRINSANDMLFWMSACVITLVIALCIVVGITLTRMIVPPLLNATGALEKLARKDLTAHVDVVSGDEVGRLCTATNTCVSEMQEVIETLTQGAQTLSAAAEQMSQHSSQSHANTAAQSDKTNQIAAAAQQMTATIGEISHNAESAVASSGESAELASQGGQVMKATAVTMERIAAATGTVAGKMNVLAERSIEIGKVVNVIQEISEQTNLLALNAAIEAARAGEHGRGFAVVAGEVRRLAERTNSATGEIAGTIHAIQEETRGTVEVMSKSREAVEAGISETDNARSSLEKIIESSKQVERQISMIATAATEQTAASHEISESAHEISGLAEENSRAADEASQASRNLSSLANELDGVIRQFTLA